MRLTALVAGAGFALLLAGTSGALAGDARVSFVAPERFTDASLNGRRAVDANAPALRELAAHIARLAQGGLPAGQTLDVEVTDVDLTGQIEPWRIDNPDLRVVTGATWPRISLRYRLHEGDRTIRSGEEQVSDPGFDMRPGRIQSGDRLFSEKAMLDDWFQTRFRAG